MSEVESSELPIAETAADVLGYVQLERIVTYEVRALRRDDEQIAEDEARQHFEAMARTEDWLVETRFRLTVSTRTAEYFADISAEYAHTEQFKIGQNAVQDFINRVGLFAVYPYLREAVTSLASRLELPRPTLGIIRQGDGAFQAQAAEE